MFTLSGLVLASGLLILWITRQSALHDAHAMADRLFADVSQHAADTSRAYLQRVIPLIDSLSAIGGEGALPLDQDDALVDRLLPFLKSNEGLSWISFADMNGRFVGVQRIAGGYASNISHIEPAGRTKLVEARIGPDGTRTIFNINPDSGYDPRNRAFFRAALDAGGKATWLDPYIFYGQNVPGITCAKSVVRAGQPIGVFTIDFTLETLQQHLQKLRASERSILCIYTDTGRLIASQSMQVTNATTLPTLAEADLMLATLLRRVDNSGNSFDLDWNGQQYFAASRPFQVGPGQHWVVGVVAPASDFLGGAYRTQRNALLACLAALLASLVIAAALARRVSRPVKELTGLMKRIGEGDLDARVDVGGAREFRQLSSSLSHMVGELREGLRLRHSIGVAMQVQQRLLPQTTPVVAGLDIAGHSKYCDETGGDYYDFLAADSIGPGKLMIVIGDVMGHGIGSALVMTSARAVLRDRANEIVTLSDLLNRLNHLIGRDTDGQFMTMQIVIIDTAADQYTFASAGHDAAIIYRAATRSFEEIDEAGLPLGVSDDEVYQDYRAAGLAAGDIVLIGTDGVWEMHGPNETMFGKDRLRDLISENAEKSASEIRAAIDAALTGFRGDLPVADDVTFVLVKRSDQTAA